MRHSLSASFAEPKGKRRIFFRERLRTDIKMKVCFMVLALVAISAAEPPAPQYGAPGNTEIQDYMSPPPSSQYGAPSSQYGAPSSQYGAPSSQYGAPSSQYGAPSSQYGAPSSQYGAPSSQYQGSGSNGYRKASASKSSIRFGSPGRKYGAPSAKYGAPSAKYGAPSAKYGAPSAQYGAPSLQTKAIFTAAQQYNGNGGYQSAPSSQYGAPAVNGGGYSYGKAGDDDMSEPASYQFQYEVSDEKEGAEFGHQEEREGDDTKGEYRVLLPDGRTQVVTYTADERGFLPEVRFEEPRNNGYGRGPQKGYY